MGTSQYVYFALASETTSAADMTVRLGVQPDEYTVRGSKRTEPPGPVNHSWKLVCRQSGLRLDEQADHVLSRLQPLADQVRALTEAGDITAHLQFVRDFDDDEAAPAPMVEMYVDKDRIEMGPDPNYLLGWHLSADSIRLLARVGATIDADEYGT